MAKIILNVKDLTIYHRNKISREASKQRVILNKLNFSVSTGQIVSILGPSGVGKSTLLSALAGLHQAMTGQIDILGQAVAQQKSQLAIMFQDAILLSWLDVAENVAFGLRFKQQQALDATQIKQRVQQALNCVKLQHDHAAKPDTLSGGMAQRVALARALAKMPKLLLLDEPFSALDQLNRHHLQTLLQQLVAQQQIAAAVLVTHDLDEALAISDRILFLSGQPAQISAQWQLDRQLKPVPSQRQSERIKKEILQQLQQYIT
ncbi:ABC transporter ATP-binding protein [Acinetobacter larvae]|uniref:ABC transporter domain-containing protein n=1 Tax=Acinetobacter larvae TaxID=1789224 RepID=A0A1B2M4D5_9GAMM|nr:ATP-binding cassette domain-containing protein [Acinetobacter larvae]AOA60022.1 hypothetical protein BFG52_14660 [Acinetobacter larvae]